MTDGAAGRARTRRTPWLGLTFRVIVLAAAALAAGWLLFGSELSGFVTSMRVVAVGVHNGTTGSVLVSAVAPGGDRAFYTVPPQQTRLIPDDPLEIITILGADCHVLDSHARGRQPPEFLLADVTDAGVTWQASPLPDGLQVATPGQPCSVG